MSNANQLVVFTVEEQCYALHLSCVERVVRAVEITPLPKAPPVVSGVIRFHGAVIPVMNIRKRFNLAEREIELSDHLLICRSNKRRLALLVTSATEVLAYPPESMIAAENILPEMEYVQGALKLPDGLVLIQDLEKFLSMEEERTMQEALANT